MGFAVNIKGKYIHLRSIRISPAGPCFLSDDFERKKVHLVSCQELARNEMLPLLETVKGG